MLELFALSLFAVLLLMLVYMMWAWRVRVLTTERLHERVMLLDMTASERRSVRPLIERYWFVPWLVGLLAFIIFILIQLPFIYAFCFSLIIALIGVQIERYIAERRFERAEAQLANAIDLMVSALLAGSTVSAAMEAAASESAKPIKKILERAVSRIQYGDDPHAVLRHFFERFPTENNRLFVTTLSVHWDVGGRLAPALATIGRTIRDRLDVMRRLRAMGVQARVSAFIFVVLTALVAYVMWQYDPVRFRLFVLSPPGQLLVGSALLLQAIGIVLLSILSRIRF